MWTMQLAKQKKYKISKQNFKLVIENKTTSYNINQASANNTKSRTKEFILYRTF